MFEDMFYDLDDDFPEPDDETIGEEYSVAEVEADIASTDTEVTTCSGSCEEEQRVSSDVAQQTADETADMTQQQAISSISEESQQEDEGSELSAEGTLIGFTTAPDAETKGYESKLVETTKRSADIDYPFLLLESDVLAQHKLIALKSMLTSRTLDPDVTTYTVYLRSNGNIVKVGTTTAFSLRSILTSAVFADFKKYVKINPDLKVEGDMLFALCGVMT